MAGVSLDGVLIGFAIAVLAALNVLMARTMNRHLQVGFRTIAEGLAEIREELRGGQADIRHELRGARSDMRAELREALLATAIAVATTNRMLRSVGPRATGGACAINHRVQRVPEHHLHKTLRIAFAVIVACWCL